MNELINIPVELQNFIINFKNINIDFNKYICGKIQLYNFDELETSYLKLQNEKDKKYYYIKVIDLIKNCDEYDSTGLLVWLPDFKQFAIFDSSIDQLYILEKITTDDVKKEICKYIDLQWDFDENICKPFDEFHLLKMPKNKKQKKEYIYHSIENHAKKIKLYKSNNPWTKYFLKYIYHLKQKKIHYLINLILLILFFLYTIYIYLSCFSNDNNYLVEIGNLFFSQKFSIFILSIYCLITTSWILLNQILDQTGSGKIIIWFFASIVFTIFGFFKMIL